MLATALAAGIGARVPAARFEGIGSERMRAAGFAVTQETRGWASLGPLEALAKILPLLAIMLRHAAWLRRRPPDLLVLVDFGAFNLRFARTLRRIGYRGPILYFFPPGAWLDRPKQARAVAANTTALTPFKHQRDFYQSLGLPIAWLGHPLVSLVPPRTPRIVPPSDAGTIALLPGSRRGELERHLGPLLAAAQLLQSRRPGAQIVVSAADAEAEKTILQRLAGSGLAGATVVRGARQALDVADAAFVASGTAVLEAALREVPTVALYIIRPSQVPIAKRVWRGPFITLPNILLGRPVIAELLQENAVPERLAAELEALLVDPSEQLRAMRELRAVLGPADALERCVAFAIDLAGAQAGAVCR